MAMPEADGGDVAAQIEADPGLRRTPIIFVTALVTEAEAKAGLHIQGRPFLPKPIRLSDLTEEIFALSPEMRLTHYERQKRHSRKQP